jgi:hypothetical protein
VDIVAYLGKSWAWAPVCKTIPNTAEVAPNIEVAFLSEATSANTAMITYSLRVKLRRREAREQTDIKALAI